MGFISNLRSIRSGVRKAHRDIALANQFFAAHNNNPSQEIAAKFFTSLGGDVSEVDERERVSYGMTMVRFQRKWAVNHPKEHRDFVFPFERPEMDVSITMVALPIQDILGDDGEPDFGKILHEVLMQNPDYRAGLEEGRRQNLAAGKCLGCGGSITEDGACVGDGDADYNPENDPDLGVSETEKRARNLAKLTQLRARLDQLHAEYKEIGGMNPQMEAEMNTIRTEIEKLEASR